MSDESAGARPHPHGRSDIGAITVPCQQCGGRFDVDITSPMIQCPFCGTAQRMTEPAAVPAPLQVAGRSDPPTTVSPRSRSRAMVTLLIAGGAAILAGVALWATSLGGDNSGQSSTSAPTLTTIESGDAEVAFTEGIDCSPIDGPCDFGDDPDLDALWTACEGGDGTACNRLYDESPVDTRYESYGYYCGDRVRESVLCEGDVMALEPGSAGR